MAALVAGEPIPLSCNTLITNTHPSYKSFAKENPLLIPKTFIAKNHVNKTDKKVQVQTVKHTQ